MDRLEQNNIVKEVRDSFLDYSMSVIVARALPDLRDGLKPVHRRILYSMNEIGLTSDKPFRKCAKIVASGKAEKGKRPFGKNTLRLCRGNRYIQLPRYLP